VLYPLVIGLLVLGGICFFVAAVALWFRASLATNLFANQIDKLVEAGNRSRAIKLCHAVPGTPTGKVTLAALRQRVPRQDPEASAVYDYRGPAGGRSFEERVQDMLADEAQTALKPVGRARWLGLFGAFVALGGGALSWPHADWPLMGKVFATVGPVVVGVAVLLKAAGLTASVRGLIPRFARHVQPEE